MNGATVKAALPPGGQMTKKWMVERVGTARLVSRLAPEQTRVARIRRPRGPANFAFQMQCLHRASGEFLLNPRWLARVEDFGGYITG